MRGNHFETLAVINKLAQYSQIKTIISLTLSRGNITQIGLIEKFAEENGLETDYNLLFTSEDFPYNLSNITYEERDNLIASLSYWSIKNKKEVKLSLMKRILQKKHINIENCYSSRKKIIVYPDGNVFGCFFNKNLHYGNIYKDKYSSIVRIYKDRQVVDTNKCFLGECLGIFI